MIIFVVYVFFFFKQKTAYEMRISDWSSDVCSSDLPGEAAHDGIATAQAGGAACSGRCPEIERDSRRDCIREGGGRCWCVAQDCATGAPQVSARARRGLGCRRSEEHTSELQSLMRISYAVFCLKKKTNTTITE